MALKASVEVLNLQSVSRMLDQLGKKEADKVIRKALRLGAKDMLAATKRLAPVDTGLLKKSLTVRALKRKRGRIGFRIGYKNVEQIATVTKEGTRHFYPAVVEYGSSKQTPHPFMRPAFDQNKEASKKIISAEVRTGITEAAKRLAK